MYKIWPTHRITFASYKVRVLILLKQTKRNKFVWKIFQDYQLTLATMMTMRIARTDFSMQAMEKTMQARRKKTENEMIIEISSKPISNTDKYKCLGIHLDPSLSLTDHVHKVCKKASSRQDY